MSKKGWVQVSGIRRGDTAPADWHPTPEWATEALLRVEEFHEPVWDPCSGSGGVVRPLRRAGLQVYSSDIVRGRDFFKSGRDVASIVCNPPYRLGIEFSVHAQLRATQVAMLLQVGALYSKPWGRFFQAYPPVRFWVLSDRLEYWKDGLWKKGIFGHMWVVWDGDEVGTPTVRWLSKEAP